MAKAIGIDLGTTNPVVVVTEGGQPANMRRTGSVAEGPVDDGTPPASSEPVGVEGLRAELQQEHDRYLRRRHASTHARR